MVNYFRQRWDDEDALQVAIIETAYAITADDFEMWHIPGGGAHVGKIGGAILKRLGAKPGIYDLQCMWQSGEGFIEVKAKSSPSKAQVEFGAYLDRIGKPRVISRTIATSLHALGEWGAPVDERFRPLARMHSG